MLAWTLARADPDRARALARSLGVRPLTAQLLLNRGHSDAATARRYLEPRLAELRGPEAPGAEMGGFQRAVTRLLAAVRDRELVGVFGDYDVDGVTTCALLSSYLEAIGGQVVARVARRAAGYGFTPGDAESFASDGCKLVVTCDCGTSDHDALARARALGMEVIIVDHHQVPDRDPDAHALINPHQPSCRFPFKGLASVGIGFYLIAALRSRLRQPGASRGSVDAPDPRLWLDLVALGTVADLAPLCDENRRLVAAGLRELGQRRRPGLRALAERSKVDFDRAPTTVDIGFKLAPRLNAPGRLGDAKLALDLLLATDDTAAALALACDEVNRRRQQVQEDVLKEALAQVESRPLGRAIVVAGDGWHPGVVGIVAARLVDKYQLPSVVIALDGAEGRGSARTAHGFHLYRGLRHCAPLLLRYGGHAAAAGVTIARDRVEDLQRALDAAVVRELGEGPLRRTLRVDAEAEWGEIDEALAEELGRFAPLGMGNPEPVLCAAGLEVDRSRVVAERHLQITLRDGAQARDGIGFGHAPRAQPVGSRVRAAFTPEMDSWRGTRRLRLRLHDLVAEVSAVDEAGLPAGAAVEAASPLPA